MKKFFLFLFLFFLAGLWSLRGNNFSGPLGVPSRRLHVEGVNPFEASRLERVLRSLDSFGTWNSAFIQDALWALFQELESRGFRQSMIHISLFSGRSLVYSSRFSSRDDVLLPKNLVGTSLRFLLLPGPQDYFSRLQISGIDAVSHRQQIQSFYPYIGLHVLHFERFYTADVERRGVEKLKTNLHRRGFWNARLVQSEQKRSGNAVAVCQRWEQGKPFFLRELAVDLETIGEEKECPAFFHKIENNKGLAVPVLATEARIDEELQRLRRQFYAAGYAQARFSYDLVDPVEEADRVLVRLLIHVEPGQPFFVGSVLLDHDPHLHDNLLTERVPIQSGDPLDLDRVAAGRHHLYNLGIFDTIDVALEETTNPQFKNVLYSFHQRNRNEVFMRFGSGSYDILRVGVDWDQNNLWRRGHRGSFQSVQSFKRTNLHYTYQVPEFLGEKTGLFMNVDYLRLEEKSFTRLEKSLDLGLEKNYSAGLYLSLRYQWEKLNASLDSLEHQRWKRHGNVGAIRLVLEKNRLNNPLYPVRGFRWKIQLEAADRFLGGNSEYERLEAEWSVHHPVSETMFFHGALRGGWIYSFGNPRHRLPFNKLFFNGGSSTIRGYGEGQAAPLDRDGNSLGAASYILFNGEIEQQILNRVSLFFFQDCLGYSSETRRLPSDRFLFSLGCGLSFNTFIGPLRVYHAWNVNRRLGDRCSIFGFSIGFPF